MKIPNFKVSSRSQNTIKNQTLKPEFADIDFDKSPFLVIWEATQACQLACLHCRAEAKPFRDPRELTKREIFSLLDETRKFGRVLFVITGGDPLERPDIFEIIRYGTKIGLRMTMTPSGTPLLTEEVIIRLKDEGLARLAVSLDGYSRESHDSFRGVEGSYDWTMAAVQACEKNVLEVQINTTMTRFNQERLSDIADLLQGKEISLWSVFFLVPVGRGIVHHMINPKQHEVLFHELYDLSKKVNFDIKTTNAQHYRRVVMQRTAMEQLQNGRSNEGKKTHVSTSGFSSGIGRSAKGVNDGRGFVFISHLGEIMPSGFLPVAAGNVRDQSLVEIYRKSELFKALRNPDGYGGKCGYCDYREVCGGSRARAYSIGGSYLGSDPCCTYCPVRTGSSKKISNTYKGKFSDSGSVSYTQAVKEFVKKIK